MGRVMQLICSEDSCRPLMPGSELGAGGTCTPAHMRVCVCVHRCACVTQSKFSSSSPAAMQKQVSPQ